MVRVGGHPGGAVLPPAWSPMRDPDAGAPVAARTAFPSTPACDHKSRRPRTSVLIRSISAGAHTLDATAPRRMADPCPDWHNAAAAARRVATCRLSAVRVAVVNAGAPVLDAGCVGLLTGVFHQPPTADANIVLQRVPALS